MPPMKPHRLCLPFMTAPVLSVLLSSCGILVGNVKPVASKSSAYEIMNLSRIRPSWTAIEANVADESDGKTNDQSDLTYQDRETGAIIALNSVCRGLYAAEPQSLERASRNLLLGLQATTDRVERKVVVANRPALETTAKGRIEGRTMMLRTVVLQNGRCIYDLMYLSSPQSFPTQENDFSKFVASLQFN
jgi:hypothetical protein